MAFQASICGVNATAAATVKATPPASVERSDAVSRARLARHSATSASIAGSRAKSTLCHRTTPTKPASAPRPIHCSSDRRGIVAVQHHTNAATAASVGACAIDGSASAYHRMNDPPTTSAAPVAAIDAGKNCRAARIESHVPSSA